MDGQPNMKERLIEILKERSVRTGTFTLASGKTSDLYVDLSLIHI